MRLRLRRLPIKNVFGRKIGRKLALLQRRSGMLFVSPEVVHRPSSDFPPHFDSQKIYKFALKN